MYLKVLTPISNNWSRSVRDIRKHAKCFCEDTPRDVQKQREIGDGKGLQFKAGDEAQTRTDSQTVCESSVGGDGKHLVVVIETRGHTKIEKTDFHPSDETHRSTDRRSTTSADSPCPASRAYSIKMKTKEIIAASLVHCRDEKRRTRARPTSAIELVCVDAAVVTVSEFMVFGTAAITRLPAW